MSHLLVNAIDVPLTRVVEYAVEDGLAAAALVDRDGSTIAFAGAISAEEAMPLAALVMYRLESEDLAARLFTGEVLVLTLDDRDVAVAVAKRQLFVVAILGTATAAARERVGGLRDLVESMLVEHVAGGGGPTPPWGRGGSGSGPAGSPVVELGVTVRRERAKA